MTEHSSSSTSTSRTERKLDDLIFIGFNKTVVALDRYSGDIVWTWHAETGSGFVAVLLDGDRLIASVQGYTYCLDPLYGQEVWTQPLKGLGVGVPCLCSVRGGAMSGDTMMSAAAEVAKQQQQQAAAATTTTM